MYTLTPAPQVRLVSLDFDGTIMVYDTSAGRFHDRVIEALNRLEGEGIAWCTNSGRDLDDQQVVLDRSRRAGLTHEPAAIISSESLVHVRAEDDYLPLLPWNERAIDGLRRLHREVQATLAPYRAEIEAAYSPDLLLWEDTFTAFLVRDPSETRPRELFHQLNHWLRDIPTAMMSMNGSWVQVLLRGLGKGNALSAWTEGLGLLPEEILAVGDHFNDLDMLDPRHAGVIGCPLDALLEVRLTVERARGYVGRHPGPLGTVDVLERAFGWTAPAPDVSRGPADPAE